MSLKKTIITGLTISVTVVFSNLALIYIKKRLKIKE